MIKLKLRGKHCPVNFTGRTRLEVKHVLGELLEYELNPDTLTDLFDELCERILELSAENRRLDSIVGAYMTAKPDDNRVQVGKGYGD